MRADRLLAIMMMLQRRGKLTTWTLAKELGVSRRTILRDIDALSAAGVPLYAEGGHGGGITLDENYRVSLTGLKEAEVQALFVSNNTRLLRDIGLGEAAERTLPKLFAALPGLHQQAVEDFRQRIHIDPVWWWHEDEPLPYWQELQQAVFEDCHIRVVYEHFDGEVVERVLEPYSLVAKASLWYLVARRDDEFRTYRISRFHAVTVLDTHFQRQEAFDLAVYWREHSGEFVATLLRYSFTLRIDSSRLSFAQWYSPGRSQIIAPADGEGWITVRYQVESIETARMFIFGLGTRTVVVEPAELKDSVVGLAHDMLRQYEQP